MLLQPDAYACGLTAGDVVVDGYEPVATEAVVVAHEQDIYAVLFVQETHERFGGELLHRSEIEADKVVDTRLGKQSESFFSGGEQRG